MWGEGWTLDAADKLEEKENKREHIGLTSNETRTLGPNYQMKNGLRITSRNIQPLGKL